MSKAFFQVFEGLESELNEKINAFCVSASQQRGCDSFQEVL
jgi:hypothetical protein